MIAQLTVAELHERLQQGLPTLLLDVRQPWEHQIARIEPCVLAPLPELDLAAEELQRPAEGTLTVVYCHHGVRSLHGAAYLESIGWRDVASLAGGIDAWSLQIDPNVSRY